MKRLSHSAVTQPVIYGYQFSFPKFRSQRTLQEGGSRRAQVSQPCKLVVTVICLPAFPWSLLQPACSLHGSLLAFPSCLLNCLQSGHAARVCGCFQPTSCSSLSVSHLLRNEQKWCKNPQRDSWTFLMSFRAWYMITLNISNIPTQWIRVGIGSVCLERTLDILGVDPRPCVPTFLSRFISHSARWNRLCASWLPIIREYSVLLFHTACPWYSSASSPSNSCPSVRWKHSSCLLQGVIPRSLHLLVLLNRYLFI